MISAQKASYALWIIWYFSWWLVAGGVWGQSAEVTPAAQRRGSASLACCGGRNLAVLHARQTARCRDRGTALAAASAAALDCTACGQLGLRRPARCELRLLLVGQGALGRAVVGVRHHKGRPPCGRHGALQMGPSPHLYGRDQRGVLDGVRSSDALRVRRVRAHRGQLLDHRQDRGEFPAGRARAGRL